MSYLFECVSPRARRAKRKAKAASQMTTKSRDDVTKAAASDDDDAYVKTPEVARSESSDVKSNGADVTATENDGNCHDGINGTTSDDVTAKLAAVASHENGGSSEKTATLNVDSSEESATKTDTADDTSKDVSKDSGVSSASHGEATTKVLYDVVSSPYQ